MSVREPVYTLRIQDAEKSRAFLAAYPERRKKAARQSYSEVQRLEKEFWKHQFRYYKTMTQDPDAHVFISPLNAKDSKKIDAIIQERIDALTPKVQESELDVQVAAGEATYLELPTVVAPGIFEVGDDWADYE